MSVSPLGRRKDAQAAVRGELEYLGGGAYRMVYTDKDGKYVYKVALYRDEQNITEHERSRKAREKGVPGIPPTYLWHVKDGSGKVVPVLCMRRYTDPTNDKHETIRKRGFIKKWGDAGFVDMHSHNVTLTKNGQARLIDMGGYA